MNDDAILEAVIPEAEKVLQAPASHLLVAVVDKKYPWLRAGHLVWARTRDFRSALFSVAPGGPPVQLNGDGALERVSDLLVASTGPLPRGLSPIALAEAIRTLTFEPRGQLGSGAFLRQVQPYLWEWLKTDDQASRALFAAQCVDPSVVEHGDGRWTLSFHAFNVAGGVERWTVEGDAAHLARATRAEALPAGTFQWPAA